jgi:hypothetical protein
MTTVRLSWSDHDSPQQSAPDKMAYAGRCEYLEGLASGVQAHRPPHRGSTPDACHPPPLCAVATATTAGLIVNAATTGAVGGTAKARRGVGRATEAAVVAGAAATDSVIVAATTADGLVVGTATAGGQVVGSAATASVIVNATTAAGVRDWAGDAGLAGCRRDVIGYRLRGGSRTQRHQRARGH